MHTHTRAHTHDCKLARYLSVRRNYLAHKIQDGTDQSLSLAQESDALHFLVATL